jgi:hypothetical protein
VGKTWEETGRGVAKELGIKPKTIGFIEARGFLCHELLYLLGGWIEFISTPWWHILKRLCDLFGVFPVCRWYPPENATLEYVGYHCERETKVYRLINAKSDMVVFFIEYRPEPPFNSFGKFFPFKMPLLKEDMFLKPPFNDDKGFINRTLRHGLWFKQIYQPLWDDDTKRHTYDTVEKPMKKGAWEGFTQMNPGNNQF